MNTTNKQGAIAISLAKELVVQTLLGERRLLPIKEYAERFGVGLGTVQGALRELKSSGAVTLNACGAQGTFLEAVDKKRLWEQSGYGILVGLLPLDNNPGVRGLATGIYEGFSHYELPIHILFARGSKNRTDILLRGKCDFSVMSALAWEHAVAQGKDLLQVGDIGRGIRRYGFLTRPDKRVDQATRVAYDSYSYEQEALIRALGKKKNSYGGCLGVQLAELVRAGQVEAALVDRCSIADLEGADFQALEGLPPEVEEKLQRSVVVVHRENRTLAELLAIVADRRLVEPIQEEVIRGQRFVKY